MRRSPRPPRAGACRSWSAAPVCGCARCCAGWSACRKSIPRCAPIWNARGPSAGPKRCTRVCTRSIRARRRTCIRAIAARGARARGARADRHRRSASCAQEHALGQPRYRALMIVIDMPLDAVARRDRGAHARDVRARLRRRSARPGARATAPEIKPLRAVGYRQVAEDLAKGEVCDGDRSARRARDAALRQATAQLVSHRSERGHARRRRRARASPRCSSTSLDHLRGALKCYRRARGERGRSGDGRRRRARTCAWATPLVLALWACVAPMTLAAGPHLYDAGELVAAAWTLGASHPPGQPLHALLAHVLTWLPLGPIPGTRRAVQRRVRARRRAAVRRACAASSRAILGASARDANLAAAAAALGLLIVVAGPAPGAAAGGLRPRARAHACSRAAAAALGARRRPTPPRARSIHRRPGRRRPPAARARGRAARRSVLPWRGRR